MASRQSVRFRAQCDCPHGGVRVCACVYVCICPVRRSCDVLLVMALFAYLEQPFMLSLVFYRLAPEWRGLATMWTFSTWFFVGPMLRVRACSLVAAPCPFRLCMPSNQEPWHV